MPASPTRLYRFGSAWYRIGQQFSEMVMGGCSSLMLNNDWPVTPQVMGQYIQRIWPDRRFSGLPFQFQSQGRAQLRYLLC